MTGMDSSRMVRHTLVIQRLTHGANAVNSCSVIHEKEAKNKEAYERIADLSSLREIPAVAGPLLVDALPQQHLPFVHPPCLGLFALPGFAPACHRLSAPGSVFFVCK